jgi:phosphonate transport system permease protein
VPGLQVKTPLAMLDRAPKRWPFRLTTGLMALLALVWSASALYFKGMSPKGPEIAGNIIKGILSPDLGLLFNFTKQGVAYLLLETVCIALLGTLVGLLFSIPLSFLASRSVVPKPIAYLTNALIMLIRTIPAIIYGLMFIRVTGPGAFAGLMTMSVSSIGMISKMNISAIDDMDVSILESLDAAGLNAFEKIRYGILPQLSSSFVSNAIYRFDLNMKDATVLGLVGAGGIGTPLNFAMQSFRWNDVGALLIGLMILVLIVRPQGLFARAEAR